MSLANDLPARLRIVVFIYTEDMSTNLMIPESVIQFYRVCYDTLKSMVWYVEEGGMVL